ncbi:membrane protein insertion efficiency factor YidD [Bacteroidales bacterium AH-315-N07]|nr:membrane protein insertion efficiency factor YidD [Bacteroidales bacterium AH-315-N07]
MRYIITFFLISFSFCCCFPQNSNDLNFFIKASNSEVSAKGGSASGGKENKSSSNSLKENTNDLNLIVSFSYFFYKQFISSQDIPACSFTPSCSTFGVNCVKEHGLFKGSLLIFDRLMRCHPFNQKFYERDNESKRLIDPAKNYK